MSKNSFSGDRLYDYDVIVIGGGSGGLAFAKEAKKINSRLKIAVFDYVQPSKMGTTWKLGGTCVNVGCIPKKLLHHAGQITDLIKKADVYGFNKDSESFSWEKSIDSINNYILSLNWAYKKQLKSSDIDYYNNYAKFEDNHTISYQDKKTTKKLTSEYFVIATGGRPNYGDYPGSELCLTSDDLFWQKTHPGKKILVVGGGYIALECANFLNDIGGVKVDVMFRSKLLKKFDEQCVEQIAELMERNGVRFIKAEPKEFKKINGKINVSTSNAGLNSEYDNVILAMGRNPCSKGIGLEKIGVKLNWSNEKIIVDAFDVTTVKNIFAIGDVATGIDTHCFEEGNKVYFPEHKSYGVVKFTAPNETSYDIELDNKTVIKDVKYNEIMSETVDRMELTPVAIKTGTLLAQRLFNNSSKVCSFETAMTWVPTTVFTSPEYAFAGMTTEEADQKYGKDNVEVWLSRYGPIENLILHPDITEDYRSNQFTGSNLWSRRCAQSNNMYWPEICYDTKEYSKVLYKDQMCDIIKIESGNYTVKSNSKVEDVKMSDLNPTGQTLKYEHDRHVKSDHLCKIITIKETGKVLGIHFVGKNAGEIIQGFALACSTGITKDQIDSMISIHPISAEEFLVLTVNRSSNKSFLKMEGCGGGSC